MYVTLTIGNLACSRSESKRSPIQLSESRLSPIQFTHVISESKQKLIQITRAISESKRSSIQLIEFKLSPIQFSLSETSLMPSRPADP